MTGPVVRIDMARTYSADEMTRLRDGFVPGGMDDKWFIVFHDGELAFHRSWTGECVFRMRLEILADGSARVVEVIASRDPASYTADDAAYDARLLGVLIEDLLLRPRPG